MDETAFDTLTRRMAGQTTRRAALGALVGGALLLRQPAASEANSLRPISVRVYNFTPSPVTVNHGEHGVQGLTPRCWDLASTTIPAATDMVFRTRRQRAYLIFNGVSTLQFENALFVRPDMTAVQNGVFYKRVRHCPPRGTLLLKDAKMDVGTTREITINGQFFQVTRTRDTNYKEFIVFMN
ncbi:MAG: hypothetical protein QM692_22310 [Thermomicrobiales bacterium]